MSLEINKRIRDIRKLLGYSQSDIAEMLGKKSSTYSQCERHGVITCDMLISLAEIFQVDVRVLLYGEHLDDKPGPILPPPPPEPTYTATEKSVIKIIRNLPQKKKREVLGYISEQYKRR